MLCIALLHYPVLNKEGKIVTTAIANMDIHDIARIAKTYGVYHFYVVNPISAQRELANQIIRHWQQGYGASYNSSRKEAFELIRIKANIDEVIDEINEESGQTPRTVVTGANLKNRLLAYSDLKKMIANDDLPYLLIFGTGSGVTPEVIDKADYCLVPIRGVGVYNHLAVRSAVAIVLDRLNRDQN